MSHPATLLKRYLTELNERIVKLDAKSIDNIRTVSEMITKLDDKLNGSVQATNQAIGDLYREKLSIQEFREFVNVFNKVLGESFPLPEEPVTQTSQSTLQKPITSDSSSHGVTVGILDMEPGAPQNTKPASSTQTGEAVAPQIIIESTSSEVAEKTMPAEVTVVEAANKHIGFPMKVYGESFYVGNGVTSIVGDVEIPPGTTVDETLVVKGTFKSRECCRLMNNVKALKDIEIGEDTTVEGSLVSGGKVTVNSDCVVKGSIESEGDIEIGENVIVKENLSSKSSIVLSKSAQVLRLVSAAKGILRP